MTHARPACKRIATSSRVRARREVARASPSIPDDDSDTYTTGCLVGPGFCASGGWWQKYLVKSTELVVGGRQPSDCSRISVRLADTRVVPSIQLHGKAHTSLT